MTNKNKDRFTEDIVIQLYKETKFYSVRSDLKNELWVYENGIYTPNGECFIKEVVRHKLKDEYTTHFANIVIEKIVADNYISADEFFNINNKGNICLLNGVLDLKTRKLTQYSSKKIFFNKFKVNYDADAKCNKIIKFIESIVEDRTKIRDNIECNDLNVVQELFGDILYTDYKFERCFMFLGDGRNGKSKLGELIKHFIGVENVSSVHPSTLEDPNSFTISFFHRKLVNMAMDVNSTAFKHISLIKSLSGRDPVTAPRKFMTPFVFVNYAKLIFGANQLPITYDTKDSFWERWVLINFPYTFTDQMTINDCKDKSIKKFLKLKNPNIIEDIVNPKQLSGLLNWAIDGLNRLMENGNYSYKYAPNEVKSLWIRKSDSYGAFIIDFLDFDYDSKISKKDLRKVYANYCKTHKLKLSGDKSIKYKMAEEGVSDDRLRDNLIDDYVWEGVKFKSSVGGILNSNKLSTIKHLDSKKEETILVQNVTEVNMVTEEVK